MYSADFVSFLFFAVSVMSIGGYLYIKRRNRPRYRNLPAKPEDVKADI
ncbi:MAG: hypothetical protein NT157_01440 [Candidatus Micrarchaeota archaeon]|nr:hypothetical protein [Candidatus Micrarchaeota archaeon]